MMHIFDKLVLLAFEPACAWLAGKGISAYRVAQRAILGVGVLGIASIVAECAVQQQITFAVIIPGVVFVAIAPVMAMILSDLAKTHEAATTMYAGRRVSEIGLGLASNNAKTIIYLAFVVLLFSLSTNWGFMVISGQHVTTYFPPPCLTIGLFLIVQYCSQTLECCRMPPLTPPGQGRRKLAFQ